MVGERGGRIVARVMAMLFWWWEGVDGMVWRVDGRVFWKCWVKRTTRSVIVRRMVRRVDDMRRIVMELLMEWKLRLQI